MSIGHNTGSGNPAVSRSQVPQVRVRFLNSGPEAHRNPLPRCHRFLRCWPEYMCVFLYFHFKLIFSNFFSFFSPSFIVSPSLSHGGVTMQASSHPTSTNAKRTRTTGQ